MGEHHLEGTAGVSGVSARTVFVDGLWTESAQMKLTGERDSHVSMEFTKQRVTFASSDCLPDNYV